MRDQNRIQAMDETDINIHTNISFSMSIVALGVMTYIAIKYIREGVGYNFVYGIFALIHVSYAILGIFFAPIILEQPILPQTKATAKTFGIAFIIFLTLTFTQFLLGGLSVIPSDQKLYGVFSAITEENCYRAFLINLIRTFCKNRGIAGDKIIAVIISATIFAAGHVSYWGDWKLMLFVFSSGMLLGAFYVVFNDLTANIFAHTLNNILATLVFSV